MKIIGYLFGTLLLMMVFTILFLALIYIIYLELYEIFEVDVLHKLKNKVRRLAYGEKGKTKVLGKLLNRRADFNRRNRKVLCSIKRRIREKAYRQKAVLETSKQTTKKNRQVGG